MSLEQWHIPQAVYYHDRRNMKLVGIRLILDSDLDFYNESYPDFDLTLSSKDGRLLGILLRNKIHPRRLWRALQDTPFGIEQFVLAKLSPMLVPHDEADPLGRRFGPPAGNRFGNR